MVFPKLKGAVSSGKTVRITFLAGLILLVLTGGIFTAVYFMGGNPKEGEEENFFRLLREYDRTVLQVMDIRREAAALNRGLDQLEKRAIGLESHLSVLKRRRTLGQIYPPSMETYRQAVKRAVKAYPWSQPVAALASAAVVKDTALDSKAEEELRGYLSLLTDPAFNNLRLGLHVLLGDFGSPEKASSLPQRLVSDGSEDITTDLAMVKILGGSASAGADIQVALNAEPPPSDDFIRFAAEYYYDFGDLSRSAQLFSRIETDQALLRQADALYLAGYSGSARSIWSILAELPNDASLYNLAVTAEDREEEAAFLEKLAGISNLQTDTANIDSRQFGLIRYSRLLEPEQAVALLESSEQIRPSQFPLVDLELRKRRAYFWEAGRQMAETWLLLDRHPENEELYLWAAWFIFYQRFYGEARPFLRRTEQDRVSGRWSLLYEAVLSMQEGDIDTAEMILRGLSGQLAEWPVSANMGRVLESQRSPARALEQYERAAARVQNPKTASRIHVRIAKCHTAMGRSSEALKALCHALDLDPENLSAQLELERVR